MGPEYQYDGSDVIGCVIVTVFFVSLAWWGATYGMYTVHEDADKKPWIVYKGQPYDLVKR
jgi:hypothetical protein